MSIQSFNIPDRKNFISGKSIPGEEKQFKGYIVQIDEGRSLYFDGDKANFVFEVIDGISRISKISSEGRRQILSFGFQGHILGITNDQKYSHDCDAITPLKVRVYNKASFSHLIENDSRFCRYFFEKTVSEVNQMHNHFMMLGNKSASEKVAFFLCVLVQYIGVQKGKTVRLSLPIKRVDIADFLGLTIETVSRSFSSLKEKKVIKISKCQIIDVLEPKRLSKIACNASLIKPS